MDRRSFLIAGTSSLLGSCATTFDREQSMQLPHDRLAQLEREFNGRLGVYALNTSNNAQINYRAEERFAFCSTFKLFIAAAILEKSISNPKLMQQVINFTRDDLKKSGYVPITEQHVETGLSVAELCAAAMEYSDNGAANSLMKIIGGPASVTTFARSIGDKEFRLDRWEPELNTAIPGDVRDTSTPFAMARSLQKLVFGNGLPEKQREQLLTWLRSNTTGASRIRAGVPADWQVGDKTGTGDYGVANDLGVLWSPTGIPIIASIYTAGLEKNAEHRNDVLAAATRIIVDHMNGTL